MRIQSSATEKRSIALPPRGAGLGLAGLGVLAFSFTFPATVLALDGLDPYLIGIGRAAVATLLAAVALAAVRAVRPRRDQWPGLAAVGLGVVFGFPLLSTLALDRGASASHAAVIIGLLPAATAVLATLRAGERPPPAFWAATAAGALCVTLFGLSHGGGGFSLADLLLFGALLAGAVGYAEGGRLARDMPGWRVICWALLLTAPVTLPVTGWLLLTGTQRWSGGALAGFGYVSAVSMFVGFFAWYAGLARAGIARASQVQLAQPVLTLVWSALLLDERVDAGTWVAAVAVLACVAWTQQARASRPLRDVTPERTMGAEVSYRRARPGAARGRERAGAVRGREADRP
ncbi:DMT family transporter [Actinomadura sp. HBU206391]|uniref:DMT family transporter n=1 Tax=Actinomadura sp. HBU206391 TaxID=2731692 RepID=UPI00164FAEF5|nr:DMT family transporter [Actinomadura sp. HBU206391]MBC6462373.1 DMT family transporter [Actinomadura sp. HBU206391]